MNNFVGRNYRLENCRRPTLPMPTKKDPLLIFGEITAIYYHVIKERK